MITWQCCNIKNLRKKKLWTISLELGTLSFITRISKNPRVLPYNKIRVEVQSSTFFKFVWDEQQEGSSPEICYPSFD
jgi:hypothetical protein